ncbi:MAG: hypothetical protein EA397_10415 [Deltaproteobacteria bacterium]|nr:MAG: hypothetical protein EA397_10415 [Deltaproteobacteria bacterium]
MPERRQKPRVLVQEPDLVESGVNGARWTWKERHHSVSAQRIHWSWKAGLISIGLWCFTEALWFGLLWSTSNPYPGLVAYWVPILPLFGIPLVTLFLSSIPIEANRTLSLDPRGITLDRKTLRWRELREVELTDDRLILRGRRGVADLHLGAPLRPSHLRAFADHIRRLHTPR